MVSMTDDQASRATLQRVYWFRLRHPEGCSGSPLQVTWMVGPPSSWSFCDQEACDFARLAHRLDQSFHVGGRSAFHPTAYSQIQILPAPRGPSPRLGDS